ncbi:hypothetical protein KQH60_10200 [Mycetohabitans sp. B8]|uniref:hypothetical protein n=1 Tax=Mycetohabitans sp. B8 TaxID=2841845 RepID=UPI001F3473AC|nr:hypothetical protein [Mycetohabitans sp. B8]MCG1042886.1 hypothetical protein [Mycetohabitans sp. B8]
MIQPIASHLSGDDIAQFSALNQRSYRILHERRRAWRGCRRADTVVDLASLQQLLDETQDIQFEPSLRTDPSSTRPLTRRSRVSASAETLPECVSTPL